jgi:hypothetical protein
VAMPKAAADYRDADYSRRGHRWRPYRWPAASTGWCKRPSA